jgi:peptidoglycan/LPS O-acetylase OafA/YrhL
VHLYGSPDGVTYDLGPADLVPITGGIAGVVLFFTLSGFLLYRPFASAVIQGRPRPPLGAYLRNRFLRILPGYWLALLGTGLVLRTTYLPPLEVEGRSLASEPATFLANLLLVQGYFPSTLLTGIGPAWSLAVELAFYLLLPLLAVVAFTVATRTAGGRRRPWLAALVPAGLLLLLGELGHGLSLALPEGDDGSWAGSWHAVVARSFLAHAGFFAAGLALAVLHVQSRNGAVRLPGWWRGAAAVGTLLVGGLTAVAYALRLVEEHYAGLVLSTACAMLLGLVVLPREGRSILTTVLASRPLQWAGLVSYGVFLWNEPVVWFLRRAGATAAGVDGFVLTLMATAVLTATFAVLSWHLVERPALALKRSAPGVQTEGGLGASEVRPERGEQEKDGPGASGLPGSTADVVDPRALTFGLKAGATSPAQRPPTT